MTSKWKMFENQFQDTLRGDTDSNFVAKCGECRSLGLNHLILVTKKLWLSRTYRSPLSCLLGRSRRKFTNNVVAFRPVHVYQTWFRSVEVCRSYSRKINFSEPQSHVEACWLSAYKKDTARTARTRDKLASRSIAGSRVVPRPNVLRRTYVHVTWTTANC